MLTKRLYNDPQDCAPIPIAACKLTRIVYFLAKHPYTKPIGYWSIAVCPVPFVLCVNINKIIPSHEMDYL
jgi:hypothetical protein